MPMVIFDHDRYYRDANRPARLLFRKSLEEMRELRIEDLAPPGGLDEPERVVEEVRKAGFRTGHYEMGFEDGSRLPIVYYTLADALPGSTSRSSCPPNGRTRSSCRRPTRPPRAAGSPNASCR